MKYLFFPFPICATYCSFSKGELVGRYSASTNAIIINGKFIDASEDSYNLLFSTIRHELRHGYQTEAIKNPNDFIVSNTMIELWQSNSLNYLSATDNEYDNCIKQILEEDARDFGDVSY